MTRAILKDKFLGVTLITIFFGFVYFRKTSDLIFLIIILSVIFSFLALASFFRSDLYIQNFSIENESLSIMYQKKFSKNKWDTFFITQESVESIDFNSKSFLESFHKISIKYKDSKGLYDTKVFKTSSDYIFIRILHHINKENKHL